MADVNGFPPPSVDYDKAAQEYLRSLPLEHFMEATPQATQREITLESLALLRARRPEVQVFNELLVQYLHGGRLGQVVPDNMVVVSSRPVRAVGSFNLELEPGPPLWVMEYVSPSNLRKDYEDNFRKYEQELRVPYYLLFYPEQQDLRLYHLNGKKYTMVSANAQGRFALPELDLEMGLVDGWVRYWHSGQLLELPAELQGRLDQLEAQVEQAKKQIKNAERLNQRLKQRAEQHKQRAEQHKQRAEQEKQQRLIAEAEVARLRALLEEK